MNALFGKKIGMTRIFNAAGRQVPVTVLAVGPCVVIQRKTVECDGYSAVQLGFQERRANGVNKPMAGHFKKATAASFRLISEVALGAAEAVREGEELTVKLFEGVKHVDVCGVTKGKGFQGVMRRHGFHGQPGSHGHTMHRRPGSVGMREHPGRLLKNKKLPGHMGHVQVTTQNLEVVQIRPDDHVLLVRGSVPGPTGGFVEIRKALKKAAKAQA